MGDFYSGFDMRNEKVVNMIEEGVVDSFSVVRAVVEDAISLAGMLLTTECILVKEKSYEPLPLSHYQDRREIF